MIVTCPNCEARYAVDPLAIGPAGRTVQCARCDNRWYQRVESPRSAPDVVIRPPARESVGTTLPVPVPAKPPPKPWGRIVAIAAAIIVVLALAGAGYYFRDNVTALVSSATTQIKSMTSSITSSAKSPEPTVAPAKTEATLTPSSASAPPASPASVPPSSTPPSSAPPAPAPLAAAATAAPPPPDKPQLDVDLNASKVELVDGKYVVHGQVVNKGKAEGSTHVLKFTFKKSKEVMGEKSYPLVLGPIAPGARLDFSQTLDDPPAGATEIVPSVE